MSFTRGSLRSFLTSAQTSLKQALATRQPVTLVVGNESADLDSITSAILYAYLRSSQTTAPRSRLHIPLLNIPRSDVHIRPELIALLPYAGLAPSQLITLDDVGFAEADGRDDEARLRPENASLILVDHNALAGPLASTFAGRSVGCIDHHVDEQAIPDDTGAEPRVIQKCGSCTSLVVRHFQSAWDALSMSSMSAGAAHAQDDSVVGRDDDTVRRGWDAQIARLALASVLIDTACLKDVNKVEDVDRRAVKYLEAKIALAPLVSPTGAYDRQTFFEEISSAKNHLDDLDIEDILRKDYKQWTAGKGQQSRQLGVSSVVRPLSWLVNKSKNEKADGLASALREFAAKRDLSMFVIMTVATRSGKDGIDRELLLMSCDEQSSSAVAEFEKECQVELGLERKDELISAIAGKDGQSGGRLWMVWEQRDVGKSRKQVAPLLRQILEDRRSSKV